CVPCILHRTSVVAVPILCVCFLKLRLGAGEAGLLKEPQGRIDHLCLDVLGIKSNDEAALLDGVTDIGVAKPRIQRFDRPREESEPLEAFAEGAALSQLR